MSTHSLFTALRESNLVAKVLSSCFSVMSGVMSEIQIECS